MPMPKRQISEEIVLAQALVYFVLIGVGTVAVALAAH